MNTQITIRYYYSFADMIKCLYPTPDVKWQMGIVVENRFRDLMASMFSIDTGELDTVIKSTEANTLFCSYIAPRYYNEYIFFYDNVILDSLSDYREFGKKYLAILQKTYKKYKKLLDLYTTQESKLLNDVSNSSTNRFNDTPQNGGDYSDDDYTSTYTKIESSSNFDTPMARLAEIQDKYKNVYEEWADEFSSLFIHTYDD